MRTLSKGFKKDLLDGVLKELLNRVKNDDTLMLAIRNDYINIYYRGGNIIRITEKLPAQYDAFFDHKYAKKDGGVYPLPALPPMIQNDDDTKKWLEALSCLKQIMDFYLHQHPKHEREFQQLIVRENNASSLSNASEYFITDIEYADARIGARFDLTAIRWLADDRKNARKCNAAFIEMKYGDGALNGSSGMIKHLEDFSELISDKGKYRCCLKMMESQFCQLDELGMLRYQQSSNVTGLALPESEKPEVIFLLANHNPRSTQLKTILDDPKLNEFDNGELFDLRFYVASFAGYGLHSENMLSLTKMRKLLDDNRAS